MVGNADDDLPEGEAARNVFRPANNQAAQNIANQFADWNNMNVVEEEKKGGPDAEEDKKE